MLYNDRSVTICYRSITVQISVIDKHFSKENNHIITVLVYFIRHTVRNVLSFHINTTHYHSS